MQAFRFVFPHISLAGGILLRPTPIKSKQSERAQNKTYRPNCTHPPSSKLPLNPLLGGKLVLVEIVAVAEVGVGVDVARVAPEHDHG